MGGRGPVEGTPSPSKAPERKSHLGDKPEAKEL